MQTDCRSEKLEFQDPGVRPIVAEFNGGTITSDDALWGRVRGEVAVAASSTPGAYLVPELLRQFQEIYPEVRPVLLVGDSAEVLEWLLDYRAPMGVIGEMSIAEGLHIGTPYPNILARCSRIPARYAFTARRQIMEIHEL